MQQETSAKKNQTYSTRTSSLFYTLIGTAVSLGFALLLYWVLRQNSSISTLIEATSEKPLYLFLYMTLTGLSVVLFGAAVTLFVRNWRTFGIPKWKNDTGTFFGAIIAIFASACPVCGAFLLSAVGITSGLLAFPLAGLELKMLSVILMGISVWFAVRTRKKKCGTDNCLPNVETFDKSERTWMLILIAAIVLFISLGVNMAQSEPRIMEQKLFATENDPANADTEFLFSQMKEVVLPASGFQSKIVLGDIGKQLVSEGIINIETTDKIFGREGMPEGLRTLITTNQPEPIILTEESAPHYLNVLWGLGIANKMKKNEQSPIVGPDLFNFASTGGWVFGKEENGGTYFNKHELVKLTPEQEVLATRVAQNTYRPCCDNSSFFQDCNHGSALLGLLELGAAQGLTEKELYTEALNWNAHWFPQQYIETAIYFRILEDTEWAEVDPRLVMSKYFSSGSGWYKNVYQKLDNKNLIPKSQISGTGC